MLLKIYGLLGIMLHYRFDTNVCRWKNMHYNQPETHKLNEILLSVIKCLFFISNAELLGELECPICKEYMTDKIYICKKGHNTCSKCMGKISKCSLCKCSFPQTRNLSLEKIASRLNYPCINEKEGCNFIGNSINIAQHETECMLRPSKQCPLGGHGSCTWYGYTSVVLDHVINTHQSRKINLKTMLHFTPDFPKNAYFAEYKEQCFKVHYIFIGNSSNCSGEFYVQHINYDVPYTPKYKFSISFVDQTNSGRQLMIGGLCLQVEKFSARITVPYNLLKPFMYLDESIVFTLDITSIN